MKPILAITFAATLASCTSYRPPIDPYQNQHFTPAQIERHVTECQAIADQSVGQFDREFAVAKIAGATILGALAGAYVNRGKGLIAGAATGAAGAAGVGLLTEKSPHGQAPEIIEACLKGRGVQMIATMKGQNS